MKKILGRERIYNNIFESIADVVHWEVLSIKHEQEFNLEFISTNSKYRQGVRLAIDVGEGYIEINGIKSKELYIWEDTAPKKVNVKCLSEEGLLSIYNVFDLGRDRGGKRSLTDSCGMIVECKQNVIIYKCNDAGFQSNFDKLIFQIEML